jgi:hypothetical protein
MSAPERVKGEEKRNLVGPYPGRKKSIFTEMPMEPFLT